MNNVHAEIDKIKLYALQDISKAADLSELGNLRVKYLGRNGNLTQILRNLEKYAITERKSIGEAANKVRVMLETEINSRFKNLEEAEHNKLLEKEQLDTTASVNNIPIGHLHPVTETLEKAARIFSSMGFEIAEGPEMETEFYNFDALNFIPGHPARDMQDTFWLRGNQQIPNPKSQIPNETQNSNSKSQSLLMRTHTSSVQVHYMQAHKPPFRIIVPGKVFRNEATDNRHESTFYQLEGLMVGDDITVANIKSVFEIFLSSYFGTKIETRLRPTYFPFVEPGFELDFRCLICAGKGCKVCKGTGWIEVIPGGMVHQNVFTAVGYPKNKYQGFAFGMGLTRLTMMKYGIDDIRLFNSGDLRFLEQF